MRCIHLEKDNMIYSCLLGHFSAEKGNSLRELCSSCEDLETSGCCEISGEDDQ